jgi:hypothetical protein
MMRRGVRCAALHLVVADHADDPSAAQHELHLEEGLVHTSIEDLQSIQACLKSSTFKKMFIRVKIHALDGGSEAAFPHWD